MSPKSKFEYLKAVAPRYQKSLRKKEKARILDEFCATCSYNRKYAIRRLLSFKARRRPEPNKKPGRKSKYNLPEILKPLEKIWLTANLPCSKRLKAILPVWLSFYQLEFGFLTPKVLRKLDEISPATIDRVLKPTRIKYTGTGKCTTKPGLILKHHIPIKTNQWDERKPGFLEADTVAHCGGSLAGMFAYTIDCVDIATGWTEQRAVWGKGEQVTLEQVKDIEVSLPFPLLGFDCDNGGEFLNWHLVRYCQDRKNPVQFTRSRPYHSDDNAHVEQKNWTHIRQWIGYNRFDDPVLVGLLNDLYKNEWRLFHNFFLPSMKLKEKKRVASKIKKIHDDPRTPYERVLQSKHVSKNVKEKLRKQYRTLNPFKLRETIDRKIAIIKKISQKV
jgi:hypothetical protein